MHCVLFKIGGQSNLEFNIDGVIFTSDLNTAAQSTVLNASQSDLVQLISTVPLLSQHGHS